MEENILTVMVGLPRSGKTTAADKMREKGAVIVCPDSIRMALHGQRFVAEAEDFVFALAKIMVRALFMAGHTRVVLDATNTTKARRKYWEDRGWRVQFCPISTSAGTCLERAMVDGDTVIIPVINRMAEQFEPLDDEECARSTALQVWIR